MSHPYTVRPLERLFRIGLFHGHVRGAATHRG
jgi:hypothetical protein